MTSSDVSNSLAVSVMVAEKMELQNVLVKVTIDRSTVIIHFLDLVNLNGSS